MTNALIHPILKSKKYIDIDQYFEPILIVKNREIKISLGTQSFCVDIQDLNIILKPGTWIGVLEPIEVVSGHNNPGMGLVRYKFEAAPFHCAIHLVTDTSALKKNYCGLHFHTDEMELNAIIPALGGLEYRIFDGHQWLTISEPTAILIDAGLLHSANVVSGSGVFLAARFKSLT